MLEKELEKLIKNIQKSKAESQVVEVKSTNKGTPNDERLVDRATASTMNMNEINEYVKKQEEIRPKFSKLNKKQAYEMLNIKKENKFTLASVMNLLLFYITSKKII